MKLIIIAMIILCVSYVAGIFYTQSIETNINIKASKAEIWALLADFNSYETWNPFIVSAKGSAKKGDSIEIIIKPPHSKSTAFRPKLLVVDENREIRWLGTFLLPGLFDGEHYFKIIPNSDGTVNLIQGEFFRGVLAYLFMSSILEDTRAGFILMNEALKIGVERRVLIKEE